MQTSRAKCQNIRRVHIVYAPDDNNNNNIHVYVHSRRFADISRKFEHMWKYDTSRAVSGVWQQESSVRGNSEREREREIYTKKGSRIFKKF